MPLTPSFFFLSLRSVQAFSWIPATLVKEPSTPYEEETGQQDYLYREYEALQPKD